MRPELEAGLWVAGSLLAQPLSEILWPKLKDRLGEWTAAVRSAAPWLHSVLPLYLSLLTGAVLGSRVGLYGFTLRESLIGAGAGGLILAGVIITRTLGRNKVELPSPPTYERSVQDELRWAFYRGAAAGWLRSIWAGGLAGFGLAILEWLLSQRPWQEQTWRQPEHAVKLVRCAISTGLYILSGNFWLVVGIQILTVVAWRVRVDRGQSATEETG